jgi:hypothetical protein
MKLEFNFENSETLEGAVFVALLTKELKEAKEALPLAWNIDDIKQKGRIIKACRILLNYYGKVTE